MQLLIGEGPLFARLALPDDRGLILPPGLQMTIQAIVCDVDFTAAEPLCMRRFPFQHVVPSFKPVQFLGHSSPENFRRIVRLLSQPLQLFERSYMCTTGTLCRWCDNADF